jgi:hypothetical protein
MSDKDDDDLPLDDREAAPLLGWKPETLATNRSKGQGPRYYKSGRRVFYTRKLIREYLDGCIVTPEPAAVRRRRRALAAETNQPTT